MPRVFLHPGYIESHRDRQSHYVGPDQLMVLYGLRLDDIVIRFGGLDVQRLGYVPAKGDIHLWPLASGNYVKLERDEEGRLVG